MASDDQADRDAKMRATIAKLMDETSRINARPVLYPMLLGAGFVMVSMTLSAVFWLVLHRLAGGS